MADGRKRMSGVGYRKAAKEKAQQKEEFLAKVPRIDSIFKPATQNKQSKYNYFLILELKI